MVVVIVCISVGYKRDKAIDLGLWRLGKIPAWPFSASQRKACPNWSAQITWPPANGKQSIFHLSSFGVFGLNSSWCVRSRQHSDLTPEMPLLPTTRNRRERPIIESIRRQAAANRKQADCTSCEMRSSKGGAFGLKR
ncbi:hypothetical protein E2562_024622 [Oryza meyeriana var. granulata]|uniref:Uncharacterized protein n=1 Tax=Oryza meyeriana var. granulata TaxID=110450 RepID=A0A6G1DM99_9ORYZ|nr:hypothetical protein E2562_024622 [Oryza meyeriana var. granulata]